MLMETDLHAQAFRHGWGQNQHQGFTDYLLISQGVYPRHDLGVLDSWIYRDRNS